MGRYDPLKINDFRESPVEVLLSEGVSDSVLHGDVFLDPGDYHDDLPSPLD